MAFTLDNPPYKTNNVPVYNIPMEDGVMGKANNNGTIVLNKDLDPAECERVIEHEMVHIDQMKRGDLDYDNENVYWKGKKYSRANMEEGAHNLHWEAEANKKVK